MPANAPARTPGGAARRRRLGPGLGLLALALAFRCGGYPKPQLAGPTLTAFQADKTVITQGKAVTLTVVYSNGAAEILAVPADPPPGPAPAPAPVTPAQSGQPITLSPAQSTIYTAQVSVLAGGVVKTVTSAPVTVKVVPPVAQPVVTVETPVVGPDQDIAASVPAQAEGSTYAWTVTTKGGGVLVGPADQPAVTAHTAGFGKLILRCTVTNEAGDALSGDSEPLLLGGPTVITFSARVTDASQNGAALSVTDGAPVELDGTIAGGAWTLAAVTAGAAPVPVAAGGNQHLAIAVPVTPPADAVTDYTLSVADSAVPPHVSTQDVTVATVSQPDITRFSTIPRPAILGPEQAADLQIGFAAGPGGQGRVDPDVGEVQNGQVVNSGTLVKTTTFTLTVTNAEGLADPDAPADRTTAARTATVLVGSLARLAGAPSGEGSADAGGGRYLAPVGVAVDGTGAIFVADPASHTLRRIDPDGSVSTLAGVEGLPGAQDGLGAEARFDRPTGVALDTAGVLYVTDSGNHTLRKVVVTGEGGEVTTFAGTAGHPGASDSSGAGPAGAAFDGPTGIAFGNGVLYVADTGNQTLRQVEADGTVSTLSGTAGVAGNQDSSSGGALFRQPTGVAFGNGTVYVADTGNNRIRTIVGGVADGDPNLAVNPAGTAGSRDGFPNAATFDQPQGLVLDPASGLLLVADTGNSAIRTVDTANGNRVATLAGTAGQAGYAAEAGPAARFDHPRGLALDPSGGAVVVADTGNALVRRFDHQTIAQPVSGAPPLRGAVDGPAAGARLRRPRGAALAPDGSLVVADAGNHLIRRVTTDTSDPRQPVTTVATLAGTAGQAGFLASADPGGPLFNGPCGVAVAPDGSVIVADTGNSAIRAVAPDGTVTSLAGDGVAGFADSDPAAAAGPRFDRPRGVAVDPQDGSIYVADTGNHLIRHVTVDATDPQHPVATVTTLAGQAGSPGFNDGPGGEASFNGPEALVVDAHHDVFVADTGNHLVRRIDGGSHEVTTVAGQAGVAGSQDGNGAEALLDRPTAIALDPDGNLFVANGGSSTVCTIDPDGGVHTILGDPALSGNPDPLRDPGDAAPVSLPATLAPPHGLAVDNLSGHAFTEFLHLVVDDAVLTVDFRP